jgi:hypothetical protein
MQRLLIALFLLAAAPCVAAPLSDADKAALAGEWRAGGDCSAKAAMRFTLEFAVTGGQIFIDAPASGRLMEDVQSTDAAGDAFTLSFQDKASWSFQRGGADALTSTAHSKFAAFKGLAFRRCRPPGDRSQLKLERSAIDFFSVMMPPDFPTFIDAHDKQGCKAATFSYVSIDLVGPEDFAITRGTVHPGAKGGGPQLADVATWSIDAASELPNVVRLTITPLTGPDHVRGATTKISLVAGEDSGLLTIPEWDAVYRRCTIRELSAN